MLEGVKNFGVSRLVQYRWWFTLTDKAVRLAETGFWLRKESELLSTNRSLHRDQELPRAERGGRLADDDADSVEPWRSPGGLAGGVEVPHPRLPPAAMTAVRLGVVAVPDTLTTASR
jgi:hypothetical protein